MKNKEVFLDAASNTPLAKDVLRAMRFYLGEYFVGNSHSIHSYGIRASLAIENARRSIAEVSGFEPEDIFFTSGATEGNNWIIQSLAMHEAFAVKNPKKHIIVSATEHNSVLRTCKELEQKGFEVSYAQPDYRGRITARTIKSLLRKDTLLVCVMSINNETGVKNLTTGIGDVVHRNKSLFLCDCTQWVSYGGETMKLRKCFPKADYITISAHKIYGPTGVGCLFRRPDAPLYPFIIGGGQERGMRGGTSNTGSIVGMATAFQSMSVNNYRLHYTELYDYLLDKLKYNKIPFLLNAFPDHKNIISLNLSAYFDDTELASTYANYGIAVSAGSACDASSVDPDGGSAPSHVLVALGLNPVDIKNTVRISFSKYTTKKDIDIFIKVTKEMHKVIGRKTNEA